MFNFQFFIKNSLPQGFPLQTVRMRAKYPAKLQLFYKKQYICTMPDLKKYIFNPQTLLYEEQGSDFKRRLAVYFFLIIGGLLTGIFNLWLLTSVFNLELPKTTLLKKRNAALLSRIEMFGTFVQDADRRLEILRLRDDEIYRTVLGMSRISPEVRDAGFQGVNRYEWLYEGGYSLDFADVVVRTDQLSKKAFIQSKSFDEVLRLARQAGDMASSVPIIPPICPDRKRYRISSTFGRRADPKTGRPAFHQGLDFAAKKGEPVYVTGDGVVESVRFDLRGYGNQIIINHGFGYKTRYAHLSFVNVVEGMKVQRGECIGSVGNTGKSTGSHLHYEVIYKGRPTNPANYMDLNMSVEEYATMAQVSMKNSGRVVIDPRRVVRN